MSRLPTRQELRHDPRTAIIDAFHELDLYWYRSNSGTPRDYWDWDPAWCECAWERAWCTCPQDPRILWPEPSS